MITLQHTHDFIGPGRIAQLAIALSNVWDVVGGLAQWQQVRQRLFKSARIHVIDRLADVQLLVFREMVQSLTDQIDGGFQVTFFLQRNAQP